MTPEMSPSSITYSHRTGSIERAVTDTWHWGDKGRDHAHRRRRKRRSCRATRSHPDIASEMIAPAARAADARRAQSAGAAPRSAASRTQVRDGVHGRVAVVPLQYGAVARRLMAACRRAIRVGVDPRTGGLRRAGAIDPKTGNQAPGGLRAAADDARLHRSRGRVPRVTAARQSRQRQLLSDRCARVGGVRHADRMGRAAVSGCRPAAQSATTTCGRWPRRPMARRCSTPTTWRRDAESLCRRRLVLPAELLLDQPEARRPVPPHSCRGQAARTSNVRARPGYLAPTESEARAAGAAIDRAGAEERAAAHRDARARCVGAGARQPAGARAGDRRPQHHSRHRRARSRDCETAGVAVRRHPAADHSNRSAPPAQRRPAQSQTHDAGGRSGSAQHRDQRQRAAAGGGTLFGARRAHRAQRPRADPGHDVCDRARGCR